MLEEEDEWGTCGNAADWPALALVVWKLPHEAPVLLCRKERVP